MVESLGVNEISYLVKVCGQLVIALSHCSGQLSRMSQVNIFVEEGMITSIICAKSLREVIEV